MCGICGIYHPHPNQDLESLVSTMNLTLAHRGPDDNGIFQEGAIALGHRRLAIIDTSQGGHQPMFSDCKRYVLIFNGEVYNFKTLKAQLDYPFKSHSDSEVLLAAYIQWKEKCLEKLNGMYAFAIWDREEKSLFIARDRLGIKPLYFSFDGQQLIFASEIRSILKSGLVEKKLNHDSLVDFLRFQTVHSPNTIIEGISYLPAGSYLMVKNGEVKHQSYWSPLPYIKQMDLPHRAYKKQILETLTRSVERRMIADVPFGAFLSGGIDSSAIVALMSKVAEKKVKTFSVNFAEAAFSEAKYARLISKMYQTEHHEIQLSPQIFLELLPEALQAMDHPSGDGPNTYVVSKVTRKAGIAMALSGLGGDELFAGYDIFKKGMQLEKWRWLNMFPPFFRKGIGNALLLSRPSVATSKIAAILDKNNIETSSAYPIYRQVLMDEQISKLLTYTKLPPNQVAQKLKVEFRTLSSESNNHILSKISIAEISTYMQHVLLRDTDQMSMAHALEVRVPFLDHELVELALQIPDGMKYPTTPKKILVDALGPLLPKEISNRPKMGFTFPFEHWMKNELNSWCAHLLRSLGERPYFEASVIHNLWHDFLAGKTTVTWSRLWMLVVLENWLQMNEVI